MDTTQALINAIPDLQVRGNPDMSVLGFGSDTLDSYAVCDAMGGRGWNLERLQKSPKSPPRCDASLRGGCAALPRRESQRTRSGASFASGTMPAARCGNCGEGYHLRRRHAILA